MGQTLPLRWPEHRNHTSVVEMASQILSERLWWPVYEQGGVDALIREGLIRRPLPPKSNRDLPNTAIRRSFLSPPEPDGDDCPSGRFRI